MPTTASLTGKRSPPASCSPLPQALQAWSDS
jgi:hypothetical protein